MKITNNKLSLNFDENTLRFIISANGTEWQTKTDFSPFIKTADKIIYFKEASVISHKEVITGVGKGILSRFEGYESGIVFETFVWIENTTNDIYFEWIPIEEGSTNVDYIHWPGEFEFSKDRPDWYTLLPKQQGLLIPNNRKTEFKPDGFNGRFGTASAYLPFFSQIKEGEGYIAISLTPWNMGYYATHPENGGYTSVGFRLENSLGKMDYRRIMRYSFLTSCDYNDICKLYRDFAIETGRLKTLEEKAIKTPSINNLIGRAFVHKGIKTCVQPDSDFFDAAAPNKNNHLTSFKKRTEEMRELKSLGVDKLYLHLDGWAEPGYDNNHPDYLPACAEAGGWEGMKELSETMKELGFMFGVHDQYRDFYKKAKSYSDDLACMSPDGSIYTHKRWAGGPQSYLCTTQAPYYVKRNFTEIAKHNIHLDCAYLDVFTCNEGDECANPHHRMTRCDSYRYRNKCFDYLLSKNILPSSEEVNDWCMKSLVFCHYAPYDFMLHEPGSPKTGIPVPLFNLVYHDCVIEPWMMDKVSENEDYMLYALINGGAPYLIREPAYPGIDGSFTIDNDLKLTDDIKRSKVVSDFHKKVAKAELIKHELLDETGRKQASTFANGYKVIVDFDTSSYEILMSDSNS